MSDIETRLFRYFVAVAEELHFTRASLRLGISGPTLSNQIKKLETQLGAKLFKRKGNTHVEVTEAGIRFFERACEVLRQVEEAKLVAQQAARGKLGRIDIGFTLPLTCAGYMQKLLGEFQRTNPTIEIIMHRLVPMAQIRGVINKNLDVGFARGPDKYPTGLEGFEVFSQPMVLALPSRHPLSRHKKIEPAMLKDETFVNAVSELETEFWGHIETIAGFGNISPREVKRVDDLITVLTYVSLGYGIGVVPKSLTKISVPNVSYREIATKQVPTSSIAFFYRRTDSTPSASLLIKYMRRHALPS